MLFLSLGIYAEELFGCVLRTSYVRIMALNTFIQQPLWKTEYFSTCNCQCEWMLKPLRVYQARLQLQQPRATWDLILQQSKCMQDRYMHEKWPFTSTYAVNVWPIENFRDVKKAQISPLFYETPTLGGGWHNKQHMQLLISWRLLGGKAWKKPHQYRVLVGGRKGAPLLSSCVYGNTILA